MSKNFSIAIAAQDTAVNTNPGILAKFFKNRLHAQFEKIKHGCIVLNKNNKKICLLYTSPSPRD